MRGYPFARLFLHVHCHNLPFSPLCSLGLSKIGNAGVIAMGMALKHNTTLTRLKWVCGNEIRCAPFPSAGPGIVFICLYLRLTALTCLNLATRVQLRSERLSNTTRRLRSFGECAGRVPSFFLFGAHVTWILWTIPLLLSMRNNDIGNEGVAAIAESFKHSKTLTVLE